MFEVRQALAPAGLECVLARSNRLGKRRQPPRLGTVEHLQNLRDLFLTGMGVLAGVRGGARRVETCDGLHIASGALDGQVGGRRKFQRRALRLLILQRRNGDV